jgi:hypothetical protein
MPPSLPRRCGRPCPKCWARSKLSPGLVAVTAATAAAAAAAAAAAGVVWRAYHGEKQLTTQTTTTNDQRRRTSTMTTTLTTTTRGLKKVVEGRVFLPPLHTSTSTLSTDRGQESNSTPAGRGSSAESSESASVVLLLRLLVVVWCGAACYDFYSHLNHCPSLRLLPLRQRDYHRE